jgi:hypothetical protein
MIIPATAQIIIDDYLDELAVYLRTLTPEEGSDVLDEIRSHILDAAMTPRGLITETSVQAAITRLGPASTLADTYLNQSVAEPSLVTDTISSSSRRPKSGARYVISDLSRITAFLGSASGYCLAVVFAICAICKPFNPQRVGLWKIGPNDFSLHLGLLQSSGLPPGQELLGWLIIPLGLILAAILILIINPVTAWTLRGFRRG